MNVSKSLVFLTVVGLMNFIPNVQADWHFGIGTGPQFLAVDGKAGMDTAVAPIQVDVNLDFGDTQKLLDTAFGFGGYATDGNWMIQYKLGKLQLESNALKAFRTGAELSANAGFDVTEGELTIGYPIVRGSSAMLRAYTGVRYLRHEFDLLLTGTGFIGVDRNKRIDENWTDALIGLSLDVTLAPKWNWNIRGDAGFGGSDGTYLGSTGLTWRFYKGWSATASASYRAVDYEKASRGQPDWYKYDVDETTLGLTILYNW